MPSPAEREEPELGDEILSTFLVDAPPPYVLSLIRDTEVVIDDPFLSRVTVFKETRVQM
jgi:hypothetical protein